MPGAQTFNGKVFVTSGAAVVVVTAGAIVTVTGATVVAADVWQKVPVNPEGQMQVEKIEQ